MLRPLKTPNLGARLIAFSGTTAGSSANTIQVGSMEGAFTNADNNEELDLALTLPFRRAPVMVATPGVGVGDGGVAFITADPTNAALSTTTLGAGGGGDVGAVHALALGWDDSSTEAHGGRHSLQHPVHGTFRRPRMVMGQVDSTAAINIGGTQFTVTDNGTGDHTINFSRPFGRVPVGVVTVVSTTDGFSARVTSITNSTMQVETFNDSSAAVDVDFNFVVYGSDSSDEMRMDKGGQIEVGYRKSRLLAFHVTYSGGVPTLALGGEYASVADTALGTPTITYDEAFAREPVVIVCSGDATPDWFATVDTSTASAVKIEVTDASAGLGDPTDIHVLVFGSDDATEY